MNCRGVTFDVQKAQLKWSAARQNMTLMQMRWLSTADCKQLVAPAARGLLSSAQQVMSPPRTLAFLSLSFLATHIAAFGLSWKFSWHEWASFWKCLCLQAHLPDDLHSSFDHPIHLHYCMQ